MKIFFEKWFELLIICQCFFWSAIKFKIFAVVTMQKFIKLSSSPFGEQNIFLLSMYIRVSVEGNRVFLIQIWQLKCSKNNQFVIGCLFKTEISLKTYKMQKMSSILWIPRFSEISSIFSPWIRWKIEDVALKIVGWVLISTTSAALLNSIWTINRNMFLPGNLQIDIRCLGMI